MLFKSYGVRTSGHIKQTMCPEILFIFFVLKSEKVSGFKIPPPPIRKTTTKTATKTATKLQHME
jgi:hypothetical protein